MRFLKIPPFPHEIRISDIGFLLRNRFGRRRPVWEKQAVSLSSYLIARSPEKARLRAQARLKLWNKGAYFDVPRLRQTQSEWTRVADIVSHHVDLTKGKHFKKRGGASLGKAIDLIAKNAKSHGKRKSKLWECWSKHKDVAHLVTAATIVCVDARARQPSDSDTAGPWEKTMQPIMAALLAPDLVIAVALWIQNYLLKAIPHSKKDPVVDAETLWRIPENINVVPLEPPSGRCENKTKRS